MAIEVDSDNGNKNAGKNVEDTSAANQTKQPQPKPAAAQNTGAQGAAPQETQQNKQQETTIKPQQGTRSMNSISARTNYGMSRAATSASMRAIVEVIDKIAEGEAETPVKFSFIGLDGEKEGLLISALVVTAALKNPNADQKFVAHHTLLLAQTARGATAVEQTIGQGIKYERLIVAADAYDATLRGRVEESVKAQYPGFQLIDADATAVPADLDLRSEEAVRNVIANATTASSTLLASVVADDGWVINESVLNQTFLNEAKTSWAHFTDLTGQPVRSDVVMEMSMLKGRNQNTQQPSGGEFQYNTSQAKELITQTFGYIDLISTPSAASGQIGFGGVAAGVATKAEDLKIYSPRLVITNLDTPDEACELPVVIQGLGTLQSLVNDRKWISALVQQHRNGAQHAEHGVNIRDLAAIGLEAPVQMPMGYIGGELPKPARIPLNAANISDAVLDSVVQTYFHDDLLISMDVPECGAASWILSPFAAAARGDQNAVRDIFEAADLLTGGKFSPIYKAANKGLMPAPVYNDNMYVNLGFYLTPAGKRDIRDGDYIAVLNATGDTELDTINDWANLQANAEIDPMFRLTETRRIQQRLFESMTITGRAVRVTFNPAFIYAVAAAVAEAGLVYETKFGMAAPTSTTRMVPAYMRNLPQNLGNAGAFAASGMSRPKAGGFATGSFGRYGRMNTNSGAGNY